MQNQIKKIIKMSKIVPKKINKILNNNNNNGKGKKMKF